MMALLLGGHPVASISAQRDSKAPGVCRAVDFWTTQSSVVRVPLEAMGMFTANDLRSLRVTHRGTKVPVYVTQPSAQKPAVFVVAPEIEGHGRNAEIHLLADCAPADPSPAIEQRPNPRASAVLRTRTVQRHEHHGEGFWAINRPPQENGEFGDLWAAPTTRAGEGVSPIFHGFRPKDRAVKLEVELWGASAGGHRILLDINGTANDEFKCLNWATCLAERALPNLSPGGDGSFRLDLTLVSNGGAPPDAVNYVRSRIYVESEVDFSGQAQSLTSFEEGPVDLGISTVNPEGASAWDVTNPLKPQAIALKKQARSAILPGFTPDHTYILFDPARIQQPEGVIRVPPVSRALEEEGDLLVISPEKFQAALAPLLSQRRREGWTPVVFTPREIYQAFSHGNPSPESIQTCVSHAADNWHRHQLKAVLLVGDASPLVWQASEPDGTPTVPTHFIWIPSTGSWVPSDSLYVLSLHETTGKKAAEIPRIGIGRIPARSVEQVDAAVARTLLYGAARSNRFLYLSDDNDDGIYKRIVEGVSAALPPAYASAALHLVDFNDEFPLPNPAPATQYEEPAAEAFRTKLKQALQEGQRVVFYFGHGDLNHIAGEGLLAQADKYNNLEQMLLHGGSPSLFVALNCLSGYFAHPTLKHSIAESMVLMASPKLGVAAMISPSSVTDPITMIRLGRTLQASLTGNRDATIGEALIASLAELLFPRASSGVGIQPDGVPLLSYNLLGDPTLATPAVLQGRKSE